MPVIWILRDEKECVELADQNRVGLPAQLNVRLQPESTAGVTAVKRPHVVLGDSTRRDQTGRFNIEN